VNKIGRYLWASPWTLAGLALGLVAMLAGARSRRVHGTLEISGGRLLAGWPRLPRCVGFGALTLGHVILATDPATAADLRAHERVHVRQYEAWGLLFVPAYVAAGVWQWARGRHPHQDNPFERTARDA
jgi:hypothetical protein